MPTYLPFVLVAVVGACLQVAIDEAFGYKADKDSPWFAGVPHRIGLLLTGAALYWSLH